MRMPPRLGVIGQVRLVALSAVAVCTLGVAQAEDAKVPVTLYDLTAGAFVSPLPINAQFTLRVRVPKDVTGVQFSRWIADHPDCADLPRSSAIVRQNGVEEELASEHPRFKYFQFFIQDPLRSRKPYCFAFLAQSAASKMVREEVRIQLRQATQALPFDGPMTRVDVVRSLAESLLVTRPEKSLGEWSAILSQVDMSEDTIERLHTAVRADRDARARVTQALDAPLSALNATAETFAPAFAKDPQYAALVKQHRAFWAALRAPKFRAFIERGPTQWRPLGLTRVNGGIVVRAQLRALQAVYAQLGNSVESRGEKTADAWPDQAQSARLLEGLARALSAVNQAAHTYEATLVALQTQTARMLDPVLSAQNPNTIHQTPPVYQDESLYYISADVGLFMPIYLGTGDAPATYDLGLHVSVSFSFDAVDKSVPLEEEGGWGKRLSLVAGINITPLKDAANSIEGIFGDYSLLGGVGVRVTDYLKLGTGAVLFRQRDSNPLVTATHLRASPYLSLSVDLDIAGTILSLLPSESKGDSKPKF